MTGRQASREFRVGDGEAIPAIAGGSEHGCRAWRDRHSEPVPGADKKHPATRPALTVAQVFDPADRVPQRFQHQRAGREPVAPTELQPAGEVNEGRRGHGSLVPITSGTRLGVQGGCIDLMARMGHDDMRASLIYQRATSEADERIADRLAKLVDQHRRTPPDDDDPHGGRSGALVPARCWPQLRVDLDTTKAQVRRGLPLTWAFALRADDGNRTRVLSLGS